MNLENEHSYISFAENWENEWESMTPAQIDNLVRELAQSYFSIKARHSELLNQVQTLVKESAKDASV